MLGFWFAFTPILIFSFVCVALVACYNGTCLPLSFQDLWLYSFVICFVFASGGKVTEERKNHDSNQQNNKQIQGTSNLSNDEHDVVMDLMVNENEKFDQIQSLA